MKKNILIPTDFTIGSLALIPKMVSLNADHQLNILLLHVLRLSYNVHELLFLNRYMSRHMLMSSAFAEACEVLEKRYESFNLNINTRVVYGDTHRYLRNILEAENIDEIYMREDIILSLPSPYSVHMRPLLNKMPVPVTYISNIDISSINTVLDPLNIETFKSSK